MDFSNGKNLIFLVSQPRAGSTLLQLMLSGSTEIATTSEPWVALNPVFPISHNVIDTGYDPSSARMALLDFLKQSGVDIDFYKKGIANFLQSLYDQAIKHKGGSTFLDKTPRYYHIINDLFDLFPKAKFVILFRNPLAVLNSILKTWVQDDPSRLFNNIDDLVLAPQKLLEALNEHPNRCFRVKYEELVSDPENILHKICIFLGIQYSENMLNYGKRVNPDWQYGDKVGVYKTTRPITEPANKWKNAFDKPFSRQLAVSYIESLGPDLIKDMGYNLDEIYASIKLSENHSQDSFMSWTTVMHIIDGLSNIKDVRRAAFYALSEKNSKKGDNGDKNEEWPTLVAKMVRRIIAPKISQLTEERNQIAAQLNKITAERDAMLNTVSWKITAPARNSKILKLLLRIFHRIRPTH